MAKDFADFLESLNREGVAYVVIGGITVLAHIPKKICRTCSALKRSERTAKPSKSADLHTQ